MQTYCGLRVKIRAGHVKDSEFIKVSCFESGCSASVGSFKPLGDAVVFEFRSLTASQKIKIKLNHVNALN